MADLLLTKFGGDYGTPIVFGGFSVDTYSTAADGLMG